MASKASAQVPSKNKITVVQTGEVQEVDFKPGMTAKQALGAANVTEDDLASEGLQVRLNNKIITDLDTKLNGGDQMMIVGDIAGA